MTAQHDVDQEATALLIVEAFDAGREMPPHERLVEIDKGLREELARLMTQARSRAETVEQRSRAWYALVNAVDRAEDALSIPLTQGALAGALRVAELARRVLELRKAGGVEA
ncbi:DUF6415 family natural product biosynthesis protein [Streptomyces sp. NPDC006172]|uniref:DUF6415 family natural product biosynthesis protein n=1 Tax=Streptomyces sp. NPDC006172 TaxID=3154470 RepID=UPI0033F5B8C8